MMYRPADVWHELAANLRARLQRIRSKPLSSPRAIPNATIQARARLALDQYALVTSTLGRGALVGKTIGELGPGSLIPLAPLLLGAGIHRYVALDSRSVDARDDFAFRVYSELARLAPREVVVNWEER